MVYVNDKPLDHLLVKDRPEIINNLEGRQYDKTSLELFDELNPTTKAAI